MTLKLTAVLAHVRHDKGFCLDTCRPGTAQYRNQQLSLLTAGYTHLTWQFKAAHGEHISYHADYALQPAAGSKNIYYITAA